MTWKDGGINYLGTYRSRDRQGKDALRRRPEGGQDVQDSRCLKCTYAWVSLEDAEGKGTRRATRPSGPSEKLSRVDFTFKCEKDGNYRFYVRSAEAAKTGSFNIDLQGRGRSLLI